MEADIANDHVLFDPEQFAEDFVSRIAKTNRSVRDVFFLNTLFLWEKGPRDKINYDSTPDPEKLIAHLKTIYQIEDEAEDFLREESVTLERIHFAFPTVACKVAAVGAEQRKAASQLIRVMAMIECPAFARYCSSLVNIGEREGLLLVDAHCWGQYIDARRTSFGIAPHPNRIRERALKWKANFSPADLAEIFEQKLSIFKDIDEMMLDESNISFGIAEIRRVLRSAVCLPNVDFIVDQAVYEGCIAFKFDEEADETFLDIYEVLYFSGALLSYLTAIRERLCRDNMSHKRFTAMENIPELFAILREAALAVSSATPEHIVTLMRGAGLQVTWGSLMHAAHKKVGPIIRSVLGVEVPPHMTRLNVAELGLEYSFRESTMFRGWYPNLIREWALNWRHLDKDSEI